MIVTDPAHEVILGGLALMLDGKPVDYPEGYRLAVHADGATWGNPQSVATTLYSMLSAGSLVTRAGDNNRAPSIQVTVSSSTDDGQALALGEAALKAVCDQPAELEWLPPQAGAMRAVFDVVDSTLEHVFDDIHELRARRTFRIVMSALPYARSAELTTTVALETGSSTVTSIDTCDVTTGWSTIAGESVTASGGAVSTTVPYGSDALIRSGSVSFATTPFLIVEWSTTGFTWPVLFVKPNLGATATLVASSTVAAGWVRSYYRITGSVTSLTFAVGGKRANGSWFAPPPSEFTLSIRDLSRTAAPPSIGTRRQLFRTIEVGGSAPTQGSLDVQHETSNLGEAIVFTYPLELSYQPPLSPWFSAGGTETPDASLVSGGYRSIETAADFLIPASAIPQGECLLVARLRCSTHTTNARIFSAADSWMLGTQVATGQLGISDIDFTLNTWQLVTLGAFNLPPHPVGTSGEIRISIQGGSVATAVIELDEAWLFHTSGRLTIVDAAVKRLSIRAASLDDPQGSLWLGNAADWSDSYSGSALASARAQHDLQPGVNNVFTMTTGALDAAVSSTHHDRVHTHPAAS